MSRTLPRLSSWAVLRLVSKTAQRGCSLFTPRSLGRRHRPSSPQPWSSSLCLSASCPRRACYGSCFGTFPGPRSSSLLAPPAPGPRRRPWPGCPCGPAGPAARPAPRSHELHGPRGDQVAALCTSSVQGQRQAGLQAQYPEGRLVELHPLVQGAVRRVVRGDGVQGSVLDALDHGHAVQVAAQGRVHLAVGIVVVLGRIHSSVRLK